MADVQVVIPARYAAARLPGKPLRELAGLPMIVHTAQRAAENGLPVLVAYDDDRIGAVLAAHGIAGIQTRADHENGTHRLAEAAAKQGWSEDTIVVNVQGDEPLLPAHLIQQTAACLMAHPDAAAATLCTPFNRDDPHNPNAVKIVTDLAGYALYFSRSLLPFVRGSSNPEADFPYRRHIGIYAYRVSVLRRYPTLAPTPLEEAEKLEQLRFLEHGFRIAADTVPEAPPAGVDSEEDAVRVDAILRGISHV